MTSLKSFIPENVLASLKNKISKIDLLLQKLSRNYQTQLQNFEKNPNFSDYNCDFLKIYQQMSSILYIITIEIGHSFEELSLPFDYQSTLVNLFQFFKFSANSFMKSNVFFFYNLIKTREKETLAEEK